MDRRKLIAGALLSVAAIGVSRGSEPKQIWFLGDSLTLGWGAERYDSTWASQIGGYNLAISGSLCEEQVRCSLPYIPLWGKPGDTVIWVTGYNDHEQEPYDRAINEGIAKLTSYELLLIASPPHEYGQPIHRPGWQCPDFPRMDGNHFSQVGHDQMATWVRTLFNKPYTAYLPEIAT